MAADGVIKIAIEGDDTPLKEALEGLGEVSKKGLEVVAKSIAGIGTSLFGLGTIAVNVGSDFKESMSNLASITGMTADEMERMETGIRNIAGSTGMAVSEIANNAKMVAEAGGDVNLALEQMAHGTNLAISTQTDRRTANTVNGNQVMFNNTTGSYNVANGLTARSISSQPWYTSRIIIPRLITLWANESKSWYMLMRYR